MARCPSCNANRNDRVEIGKYSNGEPMIGCRCVVCSAQWLGDLYTDKQMEKINNE